MKTLLNKTELEKISKNLIFTYHSKERIAERLGNITDTEIQSKIKNSFLAWRNTDKTIAVAINESQYFVIKEDKYKYIIITIKDKSKNDISLSHKVYLAFIGREMKNKEKTKNANQRKNKGSTKLIK